MVNAEINNLQQVGRYRTVWEVYDLQEDATGTYHIRTVAYYRDPQTALLMACADGYSVRMVLADATDDIYIAD